jgi:hypothetical protein
VHLQKLTLQTQGLDWQLAPGSDAAVRYADNAVAVQNLKLVSGDQQIVADGTFGHPGDALSVSLNNVDLASVDALLLRPPQFIGRLNATSTITGTTDAPHVKADFQIKPGRLPANRRDTLSTGDYAGKGITLTPRSRTPPPGRSRRVTRRWLCPGAATSDHQGSRAPTRFDLHMTAVRSTSASCRDSLLS